MVADVPADLAEDLLSGASFSVTAKRIVFCEGVEGKSIDQEILTAWFGRCPDTAVMPVGSCDRVRQCCEAYGTISLTRGMTCAGIVERDFWPDVYLDSLPNTVAPLPVHEIEGLLVMQDVFKAVARHQKFSDEEIESRWKQFGEHARRIDSDLKNKIIAERFRCRLEHEFRSVLNSLKSRGDITTLKERLTKPLTPANWRPDPGTIFDEEESRLASELSGTFDQLLAIIPSKAIWKRGPEALGVDADLYKRLVLSILTDEDAADLGGMIEQAWKAYLPERVLNP